MNRANTNEGGAVKLDNNARANFAAGAEFTANTAGGWGGAVFASVSSRALFNRYGLWDLASALSSLDSCVPPFLAVATIQ